MKNLQDLTRNALTRLLTTFSGPEQNSEPKTEKDPSLYHVVHHNKPQVMTEAEFNEFKGLVASGKINKTDYYVDHVETLPLALHNN